MGTRISFEQAYRLSAGTDVDSHIMKEAQFLDSERSGLTQRLEDMSVRITAAQRDLSDGNLTDPFDFVSMLDTQRIFWVHKSRIASFQDAIRRKHGPRVLRLTFKVARNAQS